MYSTRPTWIDVLDGYEIPFTPQTALRYLETATGPYDILGCYSHFFPDQWATATSALWPDPEHAYSPRELEFFALVNQHLFPVDVLMLEDLNGDPENRDDIIPIFPIGLEWWEQCLEDLDSGIQFLLVLAGEVAPVDTTLPDPIMTALEQLRASGEQIFLPYIIPTEPAPTDVLPAVYAWLRHQTGSAWLDATQENPSDLEWDPEDVAWCAAEYTQATALLARINPFLTWLEHDPAHMLETIHRCQPLTT